MIATNETTQEFLDELNISEEVETIGLNLLEEGNSRYIRDAKVNLKTVVKSDHLNEKETALLGVAIAANNKNKTLISYFRELAQNNEASAEEIGEAVACASLLSANNVFYRFRHFVDKQKYNEIPGRIRMNIMMKPVLGKEFFELISLAVSAVNGCEMCVKSHEASVLELGATEERVFDAIRLASVVTSLDKLV